MPVTYNLVDAFARAHRLQMNLHARDVTYVLTPEATTGTLKAFLRGVRADDLFAGGIQFDMAGIIDAAAFVALFPTRTQPQRLDRIKVGQRTYAVQEWRGAPNYTVPVLFKLLLRGSTQ